MDYQIKPIGRTCAATDRTLEPGSVCRSVLIEQNGQIIRLDFAADAIDEIPDDVLGSWQSVIPDEDPNKPKKLDTESLFEYFDQLGESPNPVQEKFQYVLALLLVRKKRLKLEGTRSDGDIDYLCLSGSRGEGPYDVRDQSLTEDEIERLQNQLTAEMTSESEEPAMAEPVDQQLDAAD